MRYLTCNNIFVAVCLMLLPCFSWASNSQCTAFFHELFSNGVATHDDKGKIQFEKDSAIYLYENGENYNANDTSIDFLDIDDKTDDTSCGYDACESSGSVTPTFTLGDFQKGSGRDLEINSYTELYAGNYKNITVKSGRVNFVSQGGIYQIDKLELEKETSATFSGGLYYIDNLTVKDSSHVYHGAGESVVIYANNNVNIEKDARFNRYDSASRFLMFAKKDVHFKEGSESRLFVYSEKKVEMEKNTFVKGAINASDIHLKDEAIIFYDKNGRSLIDACDYVNTPPDDQTEPLPSPVAHWPLDLCPVNGNSFDIVDIVSQNNGTSIDGVLDESDAQYCQGANFDGEGGHINIPHDNNLAVEQGSVSFWFKTPDASHENDKSHGGQGLLSKDSKGRDSGGQFTIWIYDNNDTRLKVRHQSSNASKSLFSETYVADDTWYHVVYSWGDDGMQLYVNGTLEDADDTIWGVDNNPEPIILGSNASRTGNGVSEPNKLRDHFLGVMDDVQFYDQQLVQNQVDELYSQNQYSCDQCDDTEPEPAVLVGHWKNNLCSLTGAEGELIDAINGLNGEARNGVSIEAESKYCQGLRFDGDDAHVNIPHADEFELENGTVSFWFKADDLNHSSDSGYGGQGLFSKDSSGWDGGGHHLTIWLLDDGSIRARHQTTNSGDDKDLYASSGSVSENQWYHLVYSWGSYGMKMYLNSTLVDSDSDNRGISSNPEPITLGANAWTTGNNGSANQDLKDKFLGEMDELRVYEGQLDDAAVAALYVEENPDSCDECVVPEPILIGHWESNVCSLTGAEGEVLDSVGSNHGTAVDDAEIETDGRLCQALSFDGEDAHVNIPHSDDFSIANGTVAFWFKTPDLDHNQDLGRGGQGLFSKDSSGWNEGGHHLTMWLESDGGIFVRHQTSTSSQDEAVSAATGTVQENQWYHLAYSWGNEGMNLYINGNLVDSDSSTRGLAGNPEPIIFGANAWVTEDYGSSSGNLKDKFLGQMDDIRIYDGQLDDVAINALAEPINGSDDCEVCEIPEPELVAYYSSDVCSLDGDGGSFIDIVNGYNGTYLGGVSVGPGKFCNAASFAGVNEHINIPHKADFEIEQGAISLWVNVPELDFSNIDDSNHSGQAIFSKDSQGTDNGGKHLTLFIESDGDVRVRHQTSGENVVLSDSQPIVENQWHHIVYTWGDKGKRLYVDGVLVESDDVPSQGIETNPEPIIIAANASTTGNGVSEPEELDNWFKGRIDEFRMYGNAQPDDAFVETLYLEAIVCTQCDATLAHYKFEGAVPNTYADETGSYNGRDIDSNPNDNINLSFPFGDGTGTLGSCQVIAIPRNDSGSEQNAFDTSINPKQNIGSEGTISFWYQANESWNNGRARQLFDASNASIYFYGTIRSDGRILFGFEDENDGDARITTSSSVSVAANTWVHLTFTWDLDAREMDIYVNGVNQVTSDSIVGSLTSTFGNMNSIYIGDNRHPTYFPEATGNSADGNFDDVRVYGFAQPSTSIAIDMQDKSPCPVDVNVYKIEFETPASICAAPTITVKACQDAACNSLVNGTQYVQIQYEYGNNSEIVKDSLMLNNGIATFDDWQRYNVETGQLRITSASPISATGFTCSQPNCEIAFDYTLEIVYSSNSVESAVIDTQIAEVPFSNGSNIVSVKSPDSCPALATPVPLEVAVECVNPAICSGRTFDLSVGSTNVSVTPTNTGNILSYSTVSNLFNGVEMQLENMVYNDVGEIRLHVRAANATDSSQFIVKPAYVGISEDTGNTTVAAETFNMNVTAYGALGTVMPSYLSGDLQFAFERFTPETVSASSANLVIDIASSQEDPINILDSASITEFGNNGFTDSQPVFNNGVSENFVTSVDETGQFAIAVRDSDYMNTGVVPGINTYTGNTDLSNYVFTRFIPGYFAVNTTFDYSAYCGTFTYRGQQMQSYNANPSDGIIDLTPHIIELTAKNANDATTTYYDAEMDDDFRFNTDSQFEEREYTHNNEDNVTMTKGNVDFLQGSISDGIISFQMEDDNLTFNKRVAGPSIPMSTGADEDSYNIKFELAAEHIQDLDGVGIKNNYDDGFYVGIDIDAVVNGIDIREGRLRIENAVTAEFETDAILLIEYYAGIDDASEQGRWNTNLLDNCTSYDAAETVVLNYTTATISQPPELAGAGTVTGGIANDVNAMTISVVFSDSDDPTGQVQIGYDIPDAFDFLEYTWCEGENYVTGLGIVLSCQNPSAEFRFGQARGNDRIIHWREVLK